MTIPQTAAQPSDGSQHRSLRQLNNQTTATLSQERSTMLPPDIPPTNPLPKPNFSWTADPALASQVNDLPPRYNLHQFPPTPPALHSPQVDSGSYFDQSHHASPDHNSHAATHSSLTEQPPRLFASRFPRWGTWLEKRALERHYAQLDSQQLGDQHLATPRASETPNRKKSWGAWINDPDAVNDDFPSSSAPQTQATPVASSLPSLHVSQFGSRFIPHLSAQPLCSILVEIPPPLSSRSRSNRDTRRRILLVGTVQGLFAFQFRNTQASTTSVSPTTSPPSPTEPIHQWNDNVRCIPVWTGLAVYQMSVLSSHDQTTFKSAHDSQSGANTGSGVLLALTSPSTAKDGFLTSSLMQLSAHAGSVLESVATSAAFPPGSSNSSQSSHGIPDTNEGVAAANFGSTSGGGPGRAVPPGGTGLVRMWHLQAIRELLVYALDRHDAQIPINLAAASGIQAADKRPGLGSLFRRTFSRQRGRSEAKIPAHERSNSSTFMSTNMQTSPNPGTNDMSPTRSPPSLQTSPDFRNHEDAHEQNLRPAPSRKASRNQEHNPSSPHRSPSSTKHPTDPAHAAAVRLALSSVPIQPPSHVTAASHGSNASFSSLFADDLLQSFSGARQGGAKGKDREIGVQAASKGVLFFSVHEADKNTKASGTWYLAIAYARSVLVYEAAATARGTSSRAWSFLKEFYAPFPIKAVAFAPAAVSDELHAFANLGPLPTSTGPTKLRVASAEGTLTSKKGSNRDQGPASGSSSPVSTHRGSAVSAAPASWHKADLCLLLGFGRRAVLVRLRDSNVREMEVRPLAQLMAAAADDSATRLSLQPYAVPASAGYQSSQDRSRPLSMVGDVELSTERLPPSTSSHSRTGSIEQKLRDAILDKRSSKHNWVGFSAIEARIYVRQRFVPVERRRDAINEMWPLASEMWGPSPVGLSMARNVGVAMPTSPAAADKALPRVPAPQNVPFDRRFSRLHLSEQQSQYHEQLQAESSSDSDDDLGPIDTRERAAKYQLTDPGPLPPANGARAHADVHCTTPKRASSLASTELVSAKLALASKGGLTHILSLPLAAEVAQAAPLAVVQWSDTPNAVSGWARVLGVERATSRGPAPFGAQNDATRASSIDARRRMDRLVLQVGVTCVAFMASRIEARKVSFKVEVEVNFDVLPHSELEPIAISPDTGYTRADGCSAGLISEADIDDSGSGEWPARAGATRFGYPPMHTPGQASRHPIGNSAVSRELEYLCAPLLTLHPVDLDVHSCGAQSHVLPLAPAAGYKSTCHAMLPHLGGDAPIIAFDWRGADDFRIFTVGIAG